MRLAVVCPHPVGHAPSQRLKYEQYFESWAAHGYDVDVFPFWDEAAWQVLYEPGRRVAKATALQRALVRRREQEAAWLSADLVYVHLGIAPLGPPLFEERLIASGVPFVYDIDDLVHLPHGSGANPFMRRLRRSDRVEQLISAASQVVVCTEYLAEYARDFNSHVTDIPSTINTDTYQPRPHRERSPVVIGWSGSHSTSPYLKLLEKTLARLAEDSPIRLRVIGDPHFQMHGIDVDAKPWIEATEVADLSEIDIGVYPLPDEEWVLGKSGLKALQYMALEIPVVAERLGTNQKIIDDGRSGYLVRGPDEWLDRLAGLVADPSLRRELGTAGRKTVLERYSVRANEANYLAVLDAAVGGLS